MSGYRADPLLECLEQTKSLLGDDHSRLSNRRGGGIMTSFSASSRVLDAIEDTLQTVLTAEDQHRYSHGRSTRNANRHHTLSWEDAVPVCTKLAQLALRILQRGVVEPFLTSPDQYHYHTYGLDNASNGGPAPQLSRLSVRKPLKECSPQECASMVLRCYEELQRIAKKVSTTTMSADKIGVSGGGPGARTGAAASPTSSLTVVSKEMQLLRLIFTVEANAQLWSRWSLAFAANAMAALQQQQQNMQAGQEEGEGVSVDFFDDEDGAEEDGRATSHYSSAARSAQQLQQQQGTDVATSSMPSMPLYFPATLVCEELVLKDLVHIQPVSLRSSVTTEFVWDVLDTDGDGMVDIVDVLLTAPSAPLVQLVEEEIAAASREQQLHQEGGPDDDVDEGDYPEHRCGRCERLEAELLLARREIQQLKDHVLRTELHQKASASTFAIRVGSGGKHPPSTSQQQQQQQQRLPRYAAPTGNARKQSSSTYAAAAPVTTTVHPPQRSFPLATTTGTTIVKPHYLNQRIGGTMLHSNYVSGTAATAVSVDRESARFDRALNHHYYPAYEENGMIGNVDRGDVTKMRETRMHTTADSMSPSTPSKYQFRSSSSLLRGAATSHNSDNNIDTLWGELESVIYSPSNLRVKSDTFAAHKAQHHQSVGVMHNQQHEHQQPQDRPSRVSFSDGVLNNNSSDDDIPRRLKGTAATPTKTSSPIHSSSIFISTTPSASASAATNASNNNNRNADHDARSTQQQLAAGHPAKRASSPVAAADQHRMMPTMSSRQQRLQLLYDEMDENF